MAVKRRAGRGVFRLRDKARAKANRLQDRDLRGDGVERGEDVIKAKYEAATKDDELPTELRTKIIDAYQSVKSDHDEISRIKHSMH